MVARPADKENGGTCGPAALRFHGSPAAVRAHQRHVVAAAARDPSANPDWQKEYPATLDEKYIPVLLAYCQLSYRLLAIETTA